MKLALTAFTLATFASGLVLAAPLGPVRVPQAPTVKKAKRAKSPVAKKSAPTPPPAPEVFATIEDEDLVLIPENEVTGPVMDAPIFATAIVASQPRKIDQPAENKKPLIQDSHDSFGESAVAGMETRSETAARPATITTESSNPAGKSTVDFYRVDQRNINTLTYRLRIVQAILEESGRAYDYRSLKTKELVKILNRVRSERRIYQMHTVMGTPSLAE